MKFERSNLGDLAIEISTVRKTSSVTGNLSQKTGGVIIKIGDNWHLERLIH